MVQGKSTCLLQETVDRRRARWDSLSQWSAVQPRCAGAWRPSRPCCSSSAWACSSRRTSMLPTRPCSRAYPHRRRARDGLDDERVVGNADLWHEHRHELTCSCRRVGRPRPTVPLSDRQTDSQVEQNVYRKKTLADRPTRPDPGRPRTARRGGPTDRPVPTPTDPPTASRGGPTDRPIWAATRDDKFKINVAPP